MPLLDKLGALKKKIDEVEERTNKFEKETDSKLENIKRAITIVESVSGNLDSISIEVENKLKEIEERAKSMETKIERKIDTFEVETKRFDKWIKETEDKNVKDTKTREKKIEEVLENVIKETEKNEKTIKGLMQELKEKHQQIEKWLDKSEKRNMDSFEDKTKKLTALTAAIEEIKRTMETRQKELQKTLLHTATDEDVKDIKEELRKVNEKIRTLVPKDEMKEIKKATVDIDKIISDSLSEIRDEFDDVKKRMSALAEAEKLQKSFAEMKMDVASTEAGLQRKVDELGEKINILKDSVGSSGEFQQLADQDKALRLRISELEERFTHDLEKTLGGFESLGEIFANKQEFSMNFNELSNEVKALQDMMNKIDRRHLELEKQIVLREDLKDKATRERAEEAISQVFSMLDDLKKQKSISFELQEEFQILKEQIITTQTALVEMNHFLQKKLSQ